MALSDACEHLIVRLPFLPIHNHTALMLPRAAAVVEEHGHAGDCPGDGIAEAEHKQRMDPQKQGTQPDHPKQAHTQADHNDRPHCVAAAAQHCREHFDHNPGKIVGDKVGHDLVSCINHRLILGQNVQKRFSKQHDQAACYHRDGTGEDQPLLDAQTHPILTTSAQILPNKAGDGSAQGTADGPVDAVCFGGHGPGSNHNGAKSKSF